MVTVPERLEEPVGKAQGEDVVDGLFAEEVVDAKDLGFVEIRREHAVQFLRRGEVHAEGLFTDDARVLIQAARSEHLDHGKHGVGWHGEVEESSHSAADGLLRVDDVSLQLGGVIRVRDGERERSFELVPDLTFGSVRSELTDRVPRVRTELVGGHGERRWRGTNDSEPLREQARHGQVEQSGDDLSAREIARRAKEHDDVVVGNLGLHLGRS